MLHSPFPSDNFYHLSKSTAFFLLVTMFDSENMKYIMCFFILKFFTVFQKISFVGKEMIENTYFLCYYLVLWQYFFFQLRRPSSINKYRNVTLIKINLYILLECEYALSLDSSCCCANSVFVCQSMLGNGRFVEILVNHNYINIYIYVGITHILRKYTGQTVLAAGSVRAMERDKHIKPLREFE